MILDYLFFKSIHNIFNFIFRKKDAVQIDEKYFFTKQYGIELLVIGVFALLVGGGLYWIKSISIVVEWIATVFILIGVLMGLRGLIKIIAFLFEK